jgi:hypothetical protein
MESKYTNMVAKYPEIFNELTAKAESDELSTGIRISEN